MQKKLTLILTLVFSLAVILSAVSAGYAEGGTSIAMVMTPIDAQDMRVGQCMAPAGYTVTATPDICGSTRSVTDPMGIAVIATSPDKRIMMTYESSSTYIEIVSSTALGQTYRVHQDGVFDTETMTMMAKYMSTTDYARAYLNGVFPGVEMTYTGSADLSAYQQALEKYAQAKYNQLISANPEAMGMSVDGVSVYAEICGFTCTINGETYYIAVGTQIDAVQMTMGLQTLMGAVTETEIVWSPMCTYMLASPATEAAGIFPAFEVFMDNTTVSDQFIKANQKLANELRQIVVNARMETGKNYSMNVLNDAASSGETYDEDRFSDYIYDQNDYTLSDGTHVKIPTNYEYVYEGDNNVVYFSDSAFPEPGKQLTPNR